VLEDVADVIDEDLNTLSAQAEPISQLYVATFSPDQDPIEIANRLEQDPAVEYAEPNFIAGIAADPGNIPVQLQPNDPYYIYQWHLTAIQMPTAWDIATGQNVIVAVIDTGVDFNAPDITSANRLTGYDFVNNDADPTDDNGHGTHVAGTVAQTTNNSQGVAGVAFGATLLPVKTLAGNGNGSYENIIKGITYAVNEGADVINMSLAGLQDSLALREAVRYAYEEGVVVVAAAGNSNSAVAYPAAIDDFVIAVGAVRGDNTRAVYSNFGPQIDLVAPGGDIEVDQNNDGYGDGVLQQTISSTGSGYSYRFFEGTSMASPHVAGLAALIRSRKPAAPPAEVEDLMVRTAQSLGPADQYGAGLIQAANALAALGIITPQPPPTDTPTPTSTPEPGGEHEAELPTATFTPIPPPVTDTPTPTPPPLQPVTPTPTPVGPTLTPTPAPLPAGELLFNGDFETNEGWTFGDTPVRGDYDTSVVLSGGRSARLGITSGPDRYSFTSVWQKVTIPPDATQVTLTANIFPISRDIPSGDAQNIMILNQSFRVITTLSRSLSDSQTWETKTYDLSHLKGQTIFVYFGVFNQGFGGRPTAMYVDKVSLTWAR
jgi:serine protease